MKRVFAFLLIVLLSFSICSCKKESQTISVYVITGPTGIGAVSLWDKSNNGKSVNHYDFKAVSTPDEIVSKISTGEANIACVPTNLAAKLYKKTNGGVKILCVNTLGVLYVLAPNGVQINNFSDLSGKTVYTTGYGSNPQYIIDYLLRENSIENQVTLEYVSEGSNLVPVWQNNPNAIIIAPQPVATTILNKYQGSTLSLDLTDEWEKVNPTSTLMMGCVIATTSFIDQNPKLIQSFLKEYKDSIEYANNHVSETAILCETFGIVAKESIARGAIPNCNLVYIDGEEMKSKLSGYLMVLYQANNQSIGAIPDDEFYYIQ